MAAPSQLLDTLDRMEMAYPPHIREALDRNVTQGELLKEIYRLSEDEAAAALKVAYESLPEVIPHLPEVYGERYRYFFKNVDQLSTMSDRIMQRMPIGYRPRRYTIAELAQWLAQSSERLSQYCSMLKIFACRNEEQIRSRWMGMSRSQRMKLLRETWPDIPACHRPDLKTIRYLHSRTPSERDSRLTQSWAFPYINLEDLLDPTTLLLFLNTRAHNVPWKFAHADLAAAVVYKLRPEMLGSTKNSHSVIIVPQQQFTEYGKVIEWKNEAEAVASLNTGLTVHPDHAFQVFKIQERVWTFLLQVCIKMIPGSLKYAAWDSSNLPQALPPPRTRAQNSLTPIARDAPYRVPNQLDLTRVKSLVAASRDRTIDHIHQLREDPEFFAEYIEELRSHRPELLLDRTGKPHKHSESGTLYKSVLKDMIVHLYMDVWTYEGFHRRLCQWESLTIKYATCLVPGKPLPAPLMELISETRCFLEMEMLDMIYTFQSAFSSSPPLRRYSIRTSSNTSESIESVFTPDMKASPIVRKAFSVTSMLFLEEKRDLASLYTIMDELDRFLEDNREARTVFTPLVVSILSRLSILSECLHHIESYQPWGTSIEANYQERKHLYSHRWGKQVVSWHPIREASFRGTSISSLGDPSDGKFEYPFDGRQNRQAATKRAKAKTALDTFWEAADNRFRAVTGTTPHDMIKHILEERTAACLRSSKHGEKRANPAVVTPNDFLDHDITKEVTGNFSKLSVAPKAKPKTRGVAAPQDEVSANPDLATTEVQHPTITVDKRAHKVFRSLFHSVDSPNQPSQVAWPNFVHAMVSAGFGAEKLPATSAWHFTPVLADADRSIQFHEPHPSNKLPMTWAREYGRRLTRAYGWDGETFTLKQ